MWFFLSATAFLYIAWNGWPACQWYCSHCKTAIWLKNAIALTKIAPCDRAFTSNDEHALSASGQLAFNWNDFMFSLFVNLPSEVIRCRDRVVGDSSRKFLFRVSFRHRIPWHISPQLVNDSSSLNDSPFWLTRTSSYYFFKNDFR